MAQITHLFIDSVRRGLKHSPSLAHTLSELPAALAAFMLSATECDSE